VSFASNVLLSLLMVAGLSISLLQPDLVLQGCVLKLSPELIRSYGLRGMVLDVDDTLVPPWTRDVSPTVLEWLSEIKADVDLWLVSNNIRESRIQRLATTMNLPYIAGAGKPSRRKLRQALTAMDLPFNKVAMVGDRLFTDVLAGNRLGMFTILVDPIVEPTEIARSSLLRSTEIWISQRLGASMGSSAKT
jgi:uncharacterized protein